MNDRLRPLPIRIDTTSNGEFAPVPLPAFLRRARLDAAAAVDRNARRVGLSRRRFLSGLCGAATVLGIYDQAFAAAGLVGGRFALPREAPFEPAAAEAALADDAFIFDVQTHAVDPAGAWRRRSLRDRVMGRHHGTERWLRSLPQAACGQDDPMACFDGATLLKEVFLDSDTDMAVLSFFPTAPDNAPLTLDEAARIRDLARALDGAPRLLLHAIVLPNLAPVEAQWEGMARAVAEFGVSAWKVYTHWGPDGVGWRLDDPRVGIPFIEQARALGVRTICVHKGLTGTGPAAAFASCADVGPAARLFPDVDFLIYHSGFQTFHAEGPHDPARADHGIDSLVRSLATAGIGRGGNVYAELGSTWRFLMRDPTAAAHVLGKLLAAVGPERILWGTDSIWYGSPQDQILAFRAFQPDADLRARHGYPALDAEAKRRIFGQNGAAVYRLDPGLQRRRAATDPISRARAEYRNDPRPAFLTYGPRTQAEFAALQASRAGLPL